MIHLTLALTQAEWMQHYQMAVQSGFDSLQAKKIADSLMNADPGVIQ